MGFDLRTLIDKLNGTCRKGMELAAELCVGQTNFNVEIEHLLIRLLELPDTDLRRVLEYYEVSPAEVTRELTRAVDKFKRGNTRTPALSPHVVRLLEEAWLASSLHLGASVVRSGAMLIALLDDDTLRNLLLESSKTLLKIPRRSLRQEIGDIISGSSEDAGSTPAPGGSKKAAATASGAGFEAIDQYTIDLTERARLDQIDPVRGRDFEIRQIIDILMRRRQNNPILTGEAGVGKTAVVEGFALRVAAGEVPPPLQNISVRILDLGLLQAGAGIRGEFEKRLKSVINEVKASSQPIIMFIDEAHTLIGAGGAAGQGDAANLIKPVLARGELRTIAATTWAEYKKYFEKDPALARRFQVVKVDEPDEVAAVEMLRGIVPHLEKHHGVRILDQAVQEAVRLSHRFLSERRLPDKAISVMDTACARVAISHSGMPSALEAAVHRMDRLQMEIDVLEREQRCTECHAARIEDLKAALDEEAALKEELDHRWQEELSLVRRIRGIESELEETDGGKRAKEKRPREESTADLARLEEELTQLQGDEPMVPSHVDGRVVASVVSGWTGIPVGKMLSDEIETVLGLKRRLEERIIGQSEALEVLSKRIHTSRANLEDPAKPLGVFLLVGPSGIGKTETAIALADLLYGGERNMVSINMSEYQEAHTVSNLKGAPPGYVGYGKGGVLTEAVRRNPHSVVLLDEVEKAHSDVLELFYQVFDKGTLEDSEGVTVNFKNTIIFLTSNLGSDVIMRTSLDSIERPQADQLLELIRPVLLQYFKPAFLGRLTVVPYYPLRDREIREIVKLKLAKVQNRFSGQHRAELTYGDDLVKTIAARCTEVDSGARNIDHILTHSLLPELSVEILQRMARGEEITSVHIGLDERKRFLYDFVSSSLTSELEPGENILEGAEIEADRLAGEHFEESDEPYSLDEFIELTEVVEDTLATPAMDRIVDQSADEEHHGGWRDWYDSVRQRMRRKKTHNRYIGGKRS